MKNAVIYVRISKDSTGEGAGVATQEASCRSWAEKNGYSVAEVFSDNSISATTGKKRPAFNKLLAQTVSKDVIVFHQDRLVRRPKDLELVLDAGLNVHQVSAGSLDLASPSGKAVARTLVAWSGFETEHKAERQKAANRARFAKGEAYLNFRPFGNERTGELVPDEAKAVRFMVGKLLDYEWNNADCAQYLNAEGFTTVKGNAWTGPTVGQYLRHERLKGYRTFNGETKKLVNWTPIFTEEEWEDIQIRLSKNFNSWDLRTDRRESSKPTLLAGIAVCECGNALHASVTKRKRKNGEVKEYPQYRCSQSRHAVISATSLDKIIASEAVMLLMLSEGTNVLDPDSDSKTVRSLRRKRDRLTKAHEQWIEEAIEAKLSPALIGKAQVSHDQEVQAIEQEIMEKENSNIFAGLTDIEPGTSPGAILDAYYAKWEETPILKRRKIIEAFFSKIEVRKANNSPQFQKDRVSFELTEVGTQLQQVKN